MKKLLLGLGTVSLAILPVAAMVSCSSSSSPKLTEQEFDVTVKKEVVVKGQKVVLEENVIDPAFNMNAQEILNSKINSLTTSMLQKDFDLILTDFYDIYEFENNEIEIEILDKGITVLSIGAPDTNGVRTAKLSVKFELETDTKDTETIQTKKIDWVIRPIISSQAQINEITEMIKQATTNSNGLDISELKEYFLGENDDDNDFDDLGIFDKINYLNNSKKLNNIGGLIGYELKLSDIYSKLVPSVPKAVIGMDTVFFAPSAALENTFVYPSSTGKLQYEFNTDELKTIDKATLIGMTTATDLGKILVSTETNKQVLETVENIKIEDTGSLIKLTVNFKDASTLSEVISINPSLLKADVVPTPPAK